MTGPQVVRAVLQSDFAQWARLWDGYNRFYARVVAPEVTETTWSRFFDGYEPVHALVADREGKLLGLAHYVFHRSTSMLGPTCYLQDLFTDESARGTGVGRALIESVYEQARAARASRVYWQTQETNLTAMHLYDKVASRSGFIVYRKEL